ncbi:MAG: hypothetical protein U0271_43355 [Polyangiaceae bacterium]
MTAPAIDRRAEPPTLGEYNGFEVYPMPFFITLRSPDPRALGDWYERLGFQRMLDGPVIHLRRRKYQDLLIVPGAPRQPGGPELRLDVDGEFDALVADAQAIPQRGLSLVAPPCDTPWNTRELSLTDPDGHTLIFSARRAVEDPEIRARMEAMIAAGRTEKAP